MNTRESIRLTLAESPFLQSQLTDLKKFVGGTLAFHSKSVLFKTEVSKQAIYCNSGFPRNIVIRNELSNIFCFISPTFLFVVEILFGVRAYDIERTIATALKKFTCSMLRHDPVFGEFVFLEQRFNKIPPSKSINSPSQRIAAEYGPSRDSVRYDRPSDSRAELLLFPTWGSLS
jgi:hypothetical protein